MRVLIVAGGTGGHLYPGIAVARKLSGHEVLFAVRRGDLGRDILQKEGFAVQEIAGQGLPRSLSLKIVTFPFQFLQGWIEARTLLRTFQPERVLGMGGYLSVPVIMTARLMRISTLLHEQNVFPGLANRLLSRWADSVAVSFPESQVYFKGKKVWVSGLPIRPEMGQTDQTTARRNLGLDLQVPTIFVFGGSLGAQRLNTIAIEAWPMALAMGLQFQVIHVTGLKDFERTKRLYHDIGVSAKVMPYCHEMAQAYAAADSVICRSGASTIAELQAVQRPALLVPYPHASNNHQLYNARILEKSGQGQVILDNALTSSVIVRFARETLSQRTGEWKSRAPGKSDADTSLRDAALHLSSFLVSKP